MTEALDRDAIYRDFAAAVNMSPADIENWLKTDDSRRVGQKQGSGESVGHASGRRIARIKRKRKADLDDSDYRHMRKVAGYVHRHLAQRPATIEGSDWQFSLMNWGHDPRK